MMLQAVRKSNPGSDYIYVVDTRPKVALFVARLVRVGDGAVITVSSTAECHGESSGG